MKRETAISKIQKLLALAGNNPNANERDRALETAYDMLAKHNLEMKDVTGQEVLGPNAHVVNRNIQQFWEKCIWSSVATLCYTKLLWAIVPGKPTKPILVGTIHNVEATVDLASWLIKSIRKEANKAFKEAENRRSFGIGATIAIDEKVKQIIANEEFEAMWKKWMADLQNGGKEPGTQLAVIRNKLIKDNDDWVKENIPKENQVKQRQVPMANPVGVEEGYKHGKSIPLARTTANRLEG